MGDEVKREIAREVWSILSAADGDMPSAPPTLLYNEGWLMRLVLASAARGVGHPLLLPRPRARWYTEARLYSPFRPRRHGDTAGETATHADGVVGQFSFADATKTGLRLNGDADQLVVCEAKMFSSL